MKLRSLHEANLQQVGYKIAKASDEEMIRSLAADFPEINDFIRWVDNPNPKQWLGVSKSLQRLGKKLYQYGQSNGDKNALRAGRRWTEIANMDVGTILGATAAAPDGAARGSEIDELNFPDNVTNPIIDKIGDNAFQVLATTLSSNRDLLARVLKAIYGSLNTLE